MNITQRPDTAETLRHYVNALQADCYDIVLSGAETMKPLPMRYKPLQLLAAAGYLGHMNAKGYNIYCRPEGWRYVLLDDLKRDTLADLAACRPAMLIETSLANYQAWLILPDEPKSREDALAVCRAFAARFGGDPASAEPDHLGRLPGFTNRKPSRRLPDGRWQWVHLRKAEHRTAVISPDAPPLASTAPETARQATNGGKPDVDQSGIDFGHVCRFLEAGKSDAEIADWLERNSPGIGLRKPGNKTAKYIARTIRKARLKLGM